MTSKYENPLSNRYASEAMQKIFSADNKFSTWRKLWVVLAESQKQLGLNITQAQIDEMKSNITPINYVIANQKEKEVRHDVMAHIYAYGVQCPNAKPILHLGATSAYVVDNGDVIIMKDALLRIKQWLNSTILALAEFAKKYAKTPTLAYTHFQSAQPTTVGKRATLWLQDLVLDLDQLDFVMENLKLLGCRGATGNGASFLELFRGEEDKVEELEKLIVTKLGFKAAYDVSGQTYSRKVDYYILSVLSGIAQSAYKFSNDIRLLMHLKEVDEPFEEEQVGSSAMAYKRNPMRSERIASLARYVMVDALNPALTASSQWLERTLDDSANKRISIPEAFLAVDGIMALYINIIQGLKVYPKVMNKHYKEELPFLITENIIMHGVAKGGDRQVLHEAIRQHAMAASQQVKRYGKDNDLVERLFNDPLFQLDKHEWNTILKDSKLIGLAPKQTLNYVKQIERRLKQASLIEKIEIKV